MQMGSNGGTKLMQGYSSYNQKGETMVHMQQPTSMIDEFNKKLLMGETIGADSNKQQLAKNQSEKLLKKPPPQSAKIRLVSAKHSNKTIARDFTKLAPPMPGKTVGHGFFRPVTVHK